MEREKKSCTTTRERDFYTSFASLLGGGFCSAQHSGGTVVGPDVGRADDRRSSQRTRERVREEGGFRSCARTQEVYSIVIDTWLGGGEQEASRKQQSK